MIPEPNYLPTVISFCQERIASLKQREGQHSEDILKALTAGRRQEVEGILSLCLMLQEQAVSIAVLLNPVAPPAQEPHKPLDAPPLIITNPT